MKLTDREVNELAWIAGGFTAAFFLGLILCVLAGAAHSF